MAIDPYYKDAHGELYLGDCLEIMAGMDDKSVDLVLTDPPYGIAYHSCRYKYGNPHNRIVGDEKQAIPIDAMWKLIAGDGALFVFYSQKKPLVDARIRNVIIWVKNNHTAGDLAGDFGNKYEPLAFCPKPDFKLRGKRYSNVWCFDKVPPKLHPTQKPVSICRRAIECGADSGTTVLDPFIGSGTTAVAAKEMGCKYIGIDISERYLEIAAKRLARGVLF